MSDGFSWNQPGRKKTLRQYSPLDEFFKHARKHLQEIQHTQEALQEARTKFNGITDIWQSHCDFTLDALKTLEKTLQEFHTLVKQYEANFPATICHYWYKLIIEIYSIDGESHMLKLLLTPSHISHQAFPRYIFKQREEIYLGIGALMRNSDDFCQNTARLLHVAQFRSRQGNTYYDLEGDSDLDTRISEFTLSPLPFRYAEDRRSPAPEEDFADVPCGLFVLFPAAVQQAAGPDTSLL